MEAITEWIEQLIENNTLHEFYNSTAWKKKKRAIVKQQHNECQRCRRRGVYTKARTVHHKKYLRTHPELALEDGNLEAICDSCHYAEHHKKEQMFVNEERW